MRTAVRIIGNVLMLLSLYLIYIQFRKQWEQVILSIRDLQAFPVVVALILVIGMLVAMFAGWHLSLRAIGVSIPVKIEFKIYYQTSILRYLPGSIWNFAGRAVMSQQYGIQPVTFAQSAFLELFFLLAVCAVYSVIGLADFLKAPIVSVGSLVLLLLMGIVVIFPTQILTLRGWKPLAAGVVNQKALLGMIAVYSFVWFAFGAAVASILSTLHAAQLPSLWKIIPYNTAAWMVGFVSPVSAGIGIRELSLSTLFSGSLGAVVVLASIIERCLELLSEVLLWLAARFMPEQMPDEA